MDNMQNKKQIFQYLHKIIGAAPKVYPFYDANETSEIDIYIGADRPGFGITTYSTIGLSDYSIGMVTQAGKQLRVEFIAVCDSKDLEFPNAIATCAFYIMNDKYSCRLGTVYPDIISTYYDDIDMKHILFTAPYLWEDLHGIENEDKRIMWLLAVPISDNEFLYLQEKGSDALEELLERSDIDISDLHRKSVIWR